MEELHLKYRPQSLDEIYGHETIIKSLQSVIKNEKSRSFLLTGPSGVGKTTLARIISSQFGVTSKSTIEVDAATFTGIDDMRGIHETLKYTGFGENTKRSVIVDECHALSRQAWQATLKGLEEPTPGTYWFLCTTDLSKVPPAVKTRCVAYNLHPLPVHLIEELLQDVISAEEIDIDLSIVDMISKESEGSPRQALIYLAMLIGCTDRREAAELLKTAGESKGVIDLCRFLIQGQGISWPRMMKYVTAVKDQNPESIRIIINSYMSKALMNSKEPSSAQTLLHILDCFSEPYQTQNKLAPLLLSLGQLVFTDD